MSRLTSRLIALLIGLMPVAGAEALTPHQSFYRLSLENGRAHMPIVEVDGGLVIEFRRACDGWVSNQRLAFVAATEEGEQFSHDVRFSSWETLDGSRLRYAVRSFEGDRLKEEFRGSATRGADGGLATFRRPEDREITLPPGTVFPTEHLEQVLAGAADGKQFVSHNVFDGWGFDALTQIATVIGQPRRVDAAATGGEGGERRAWPVSMAYYKVGAAEDTPEFEATFLLDERGVLRDLVLNYGDFSLEAELVDLEPVDPPDC